MPASESWRSCSRLRISPQRSPRWLLVEAAATVRPPGRTQTQAKAYVLILSLVANIAFLALAITSYAGFRKYQRRLYMNEGRKLGWPIPTVSPSDFHPSFAVTEHGPTPAAEVHFIGTGDGVNSGTSDTEAWILAVLAKHAFHMFEFGTCTGKTAYLWARNSPGEAVVTTLTLAPDQVDRYRADDGDAASAADRALKASLFTSFLYSGTAVERKVEQLFVDSKDFDETSYLGRYDLIFIDGSHAYSYVKSDSEKAYRMLKPGGIMLWHDYNGLRSDTRGVYDYLNEVRERLGLVHLRGTRLVAYRAPPRPAISRVVG
jgi:predicted O-methyltransferase YrrM